MTPTPWWLAEAWDARMASHNPMFPYEWTACYRGGAIFQRVCRGIVRTSRDAPLAGLTALRVTGPPLGAVELAAPPGPVTALVLRATILGQFGAVARHGIARWTFGFQTAAGVWGIVLDPLGRLTQLRPPPAETEGRR